MREEDDGEDSILSRNVNIDEAKSEGRKPRSALLWRFITQYSGTEKIFAALVMVSPAWAVTFPSPPAAMALAMIAAGASGGESQSCYNFSA
ncbi:hypothetical protein PanWU01x14_327450 [Parasponia andersonii]|uniref:Uncharacterized protein n=1 Tax=Parasponia andersonii TaxID=3476 RepID=A0A2P5AJ22_PARAD|nr:hypothetical protein PanWU01x14_327450 [Parasponia andersonii]